MVYTTTVAFRSSLVIFGLLTAPMGALAAPPNEVSSDPVRDEASRLLPSREICEAGPVVGTCARWIVREEGPVRAADSLPAPRRALLDVVAADKGRVYAAGFSRDASSQDADGAVRALDAATGDVLWRATVSGPGEDWAQAVRVSIDGDTVFAAGDRARLTPQRSMWVGAWDTSDGMPLWERSFASEGLGEFGSVAPDPGGRTLWAGVSVGSAKDGRDALLLEIDRRDGTVLRSLLVDAERTFYDRVHTVAVSPSGSHVYVARTSGERTWVSAVATADGTTTWSTHLSGTLIRLLQSPTGDRLYFTGMMRQGPTAEDFGTAALDAQDGTLLWKDIWDGPGRFSDWLQGSDLSADGATLYVGGTAFGGSLNQGGTGYDLAALAYDTATGARRWITTLDVGPAGLEWVSGLRLTPDGLHLRASGRFGPRSDPGILTLDAGTGSPHGRITLREIGNSAFSTAGLAMGERGEVYVAGGHVSVGERESMYVVAVPLEPRYLSPAESVSVSCRAHEDLGKDTRCAASAGAIAAKCRDRERSGPDCSVDVPSAASCRVSERRGAACEVDVSQGRAWDVCTSEPYPVTLGRFLLDMLHALAPQVPSGSATFPPRPCFVASEGSVAVDCEGWLPEIDCRGGLR